MWGFTGLDRWKSNRFYSYFHRHSPIHDLFNLLLPELNEFWSFHAGRNGGEAARSDQTTVTTRRNSHIKHIQVNPRQLESLRWIGTCLQGWRNPFHLVCPRRSPPPLPPQMIPHQMAPVHPTGFGLLPLPLLWPVNIIRQTTEWSQVTFIYTALNTIQMFQSSSTLIKQQSNSVNAV